MKVKEIKNLSYEEFENMMTGEQFERMHNLGMKHTWQLLDAIVDGANCSEMEDEEEYTTIDEYLDYLEEIREEYESHSIEDENF